MARPTTVRLERDLIEALQGLARQRSFREGRNITWVSLLGEAAEHIASHFVAATIKHFPSGHLDQAKTWLASN